MSDASTFLDDEEGTPFQSAGRPRKDGYIKRYEKLKAKVEPHKELYELFKNDATVHAHLQIYQQGSLTWEQMLVKLVEALAKEKKQYFEMALKEQQVSMRPALLAEMPVDHLLTRGQLMLLRIFAKVGIGRWER